MNIFLQRLRELAEYLGGCSVGAPAWMKRALPGWAWGVWWALLLAIVALFCGQSSKFIYIDF